MKSPGNVAWATVLALLLVSAAAPSLIAISNALVPLIIALAVAVIAIRIAFFHTRRW